MKFLIFEEEIELHRLMNRRGLAPILERLASFAECKAEAANRLEQHELADMWSHNRTACLQAERAIEMPDEEDQ
jgi:hypothetical protein